MSMVITEAAEEITGELETIRANCPLCGTPQTIPLDMLTRFSKYGCSACADKETEQ